MKQAFLILASFMSFIYKVKDKNLKNKTDLNPNPTDQYVQHIGNTTDM